MRYATFKAFEHHLADSAPLHLSHLYLVAVPNESERKRALDLILSYLKEPFLIQLPQGKIAEVSEALHTQPLFGGEPVVIVENADSELLKEFSKQPISFGYLLLATHSKASIPKNFEIQGVILDLTEEKPWDREKRLVEMLHDKAKTLGKELSPDAAAWMLEHLEPDCDLLFGELEKLICYCASKRMVERSDAEAICTKNRTRALWFLAEDLVWEQTDRLTDDEIRDSFHPLLALVRTQLSIGLKMHELFESGVPYLEWGGYFPKLRPKALEKKAHHAKRLGKAYFRNGLDHLFQIDFLSKSSSVSNEALCDLLRVKLKT